MWRHCSDGHFQRTAVCEFISIDAIVQWQSQVTIDWVKIAATKKETLNIPWVLTVFQPIFPLKTLQNVYYISLPYLVILWLYNGVINNTSIVNSSWNLLRLRLSVKHKGDCWIIKILISFSFSINSNFCRISKNCFP